MENIENTEEKIENIENTEEKMESTVSFWQKTKNFLEAATHYSAIGIFLLSSYTYNVVANEKMTFEREKVAVVQKLNTAATKIKRQTQIIAKMKAKFVQEYEEFRLEQVKFQKDMEKRLADRLHKGSKFVPGGYILAGGLTCETNVVWTWNLDIHCQPTKEMYVNYRKNLEIQKKEEENGIFNRPSIFSMGKYLDKGVETKEVKKGSGREEVKIEHNVIPAMGYFGPTVEDPADGRDSFSAQYKNYRYKIVGKVVRVVDGDTIHVMTNNGRKKVRFYGIDTAETYRPKCVMERKKGLAAKKVLKDMINGRIVEVRVKTTDRYGRLVANVYLGKVDVGGWMVSHGYAKVWDYDGGQKKPNWC